MKGKIDTVYCDTLYITKETHAIKKMRTFEERPQTGFDATFLIAAFVGLLFYAASKGFRLRC